MASADVTPVVIEAAINGETRPERNPNVPRKPEEIVADTFRCLDAGASLIHAHNDDILQHGRAAALVAEVGRPVASNADAVRILGLPTTG